MEANQIKSFIQNGFIKIENAFPQSLADEVSAIVLRDSGCSRDPQTWTKPVVRLGEYSQEAFVKAANTPVLHAAFDALVGPQRWAPRMSLGSFPVRFPHPDAPGDDGWHVDASFPGADANDFFGWRVNIASKGRVLLMLFLFSDVSAKDAPTRIRSGSHREVARMLLPYGEAGLSFMELAQKLDQTDHFPEAYATGAAGTVYLCHPFLAHAAQAHHGAIPRIMAQPPLFPREPLRLARADGSYSPVEQAIREACPQEDFHQFSLT